MTRPRSSLFLVAVLGGAACQPAAQPIMQPAVQPAAQRAVLEQMRPANAPGLAAHDLRDLCYTYLSEGGNVTVFGDSKGVARARSFRQGNASVLWFREGGQEYIVRDPDTLAQLEAAGTAGREPSVEEHKLDRQHDGLERKREQLDSKRDEIKSRREALTERESELAERESKDSASATRENLATQRREIQREQQALAEEMRGLEPSRKEVRAQIDAIQRQIDALRLKRELASRDEVRALFRRAITAGKATPAR